MPAAKQEDPYRHHELKSHGSDDGADDIELPSLKLPMDDDTLEHLSLMDHEDSEGDDVLDLVQLSAPSSAPNTGTATNTQLAFNIIISFVGAGLLGMPYAMLQSGWLLGSIALSIVSALNVYAMLCLVSVRKKLEQDGHKNIHGYGDVGRIVMGVHGEKLVNLCLVISQIGFATAYIIFISSNVQSMYPDVPSAVICFGCAPILICLVQAKEMATLSPFSLLADVANVAGLSAVLFQDFEHYHHDDTIQMANWSQLYYVIAISVYSLEGVGLILPLESSAIDRKSFPFLLKTVIGCITVIMAMFGTAGYLAFGNQTVAPITLNLGTHTVAAWFVKSCLCLALYFTYPIMMFPVHQVLEPLCSSAASSTTKSVLYRVFLVLVTAAVAYGIPDFGKFLSLVGSSICTLLGFILPCYFHLQVFEWTRCWQVVLNITIVAGASVFAVIGTYHSFKSLLDGEDGGGGEL